MQVGNVDEHFIGDLEWRWQAQAQIDGDLRIADCGDRLFSQTAEDSATEVRHAIRESHDPVYEGPHAIPESHGEMASTGSCVNPTQLCHARWCH